MKELFRCLNLFYPFWFLHRIFYTIERATSIVDLKVRKEEGGVLGGRGYKERVCLPINIAPWEVKRVEFRMDKTDKNNMDHIYVRDIDDHKLEIKPSSGDWDRVSTKSWY